MDDAILTELLADIESDRVERTVSTKDTDKFAMAVCAFANDMPGNRSPGYLFVGATPDGQPSGAAISDDLLCSLGDLQRNGTIGPLFSINVQKRTLNGGDMAVVEVLPSDLPPVRYKGQVWIRVGPSKVIANEQQERILTERRSARALTWDARACVGASLDDLALDLFTLNYRTRAVARDIIEQNERSIDRQLAALRFLDPKSGTPTNAAILLFGNDPLAFAPGAYVQYVQYEGTNQGSDPVRDRRIDGDLRSVLQMLHDLAEDASRRRPETENGTQERDVFDYPPIALHELWMNAVVHRNYEGSTSPVLISHFSDRMETWSPGGLFGDLSPSTFPDGVSYRNPVLAEAAKVLGFANRFGRGIIRAQEALRANGSAEARFDIQPNHFLVTVAQRP